ncbi:MAG: cytochrome c biogenesis protein CcdA [Candidatus Omnitrophota bacterium]|nr:cytochrome c biogenesis protein CcdA [Candidatus Omnitrophota bacterium]
MLHSSNIIRDLFLAFGAGVLVSFSPCVYPLAPITLSFIGIESKGSKLKGFRLSCIYVLGLAVTYSILGAFAAFTGKLFGQIATHPVSYIIAGNVFVLFGLSFLGVFDIPVFGLYLHNRIKITSQLSVFLFGMISGLVVGPCTAPALGAILVYVATKQNLIFGMSLLFSFAYGVGALLILVGTFGSVLLGLPKSGEWLVRIKIIGGIILIVAGEYFLIQAGRRM